MNDHDIIGTIGDLVTEEKGLRARVGDGRGLSEPERARLADVEERLDQCWDLLRQRRALEEFGENPDQARARPVQQVESYEQ